MKASFRSYRVVALCCGSFCKHLDKKFCKEADLPVTVSGDLVTIMIIAM
jgi:hypothetical protein